MSRERLKEIRMRIRLKSSVEERSQCARPMLNPAPVELNLESRLEDYLDHLNAELVGVVPFGRRQDLRRELRSHLMALADAYEELGSSPEDALTEALEKFGAPHLIARQWLLEWAPRRRGLHTLEACRAALPWVAIPTAVMWWQTASNPGWMISHPMFESAVLLPVLFGFLCGWMGKRSRASGTCLALALATLATAVLYGFSPGEDQRNGLIALALMQFFAWVPLGTAAATVAGFIKDRERAARAAR
jgi:hypothetical protein